MLDTVNNFKVNFRRNAINEVFLFTCALRLIRRTCRADILWRTYVQHLNAPSFEEVEGYIGLGLSLGQPICQSMRGLRLHWFENHWR